MIVPESAQRHLHNISKIIVEGNIMLKHMGSILKYILLEVPRSSTAASVQPGICT